jgi:hypothetical protein
MLNTQETCGALPPRKYPFKDIGGGHSDNMECLMPISHIGPHLYFAKTHNEYFIWEMIDEASNMGDICEECPWASDENLASSEECDCAYHDYASKQEAEQFLKNGKVTKPTRLCAR